MNNLFYSQNYDYLNAYNQEQINEELVKSATDNDEKLVQYLLTSNNLLFKADIYYKKNIVFMKACINGNLSLVQYLLHSPQLTSHIEIERVAQMGLLRACEKGNLNIVKYLLDSPDLKKHAIFHTTSEDWAIRHLTEGNKIDIIEYIVKDYCVKKKNKLVIDQLFFQACVEQNKDIVLFLKDQIYFDKQSFDIFIKTIELFNNDIDMDYTSNTVIFIADILFPKDNEQDKNTAFIFDSFCTYFSDIAYLLKDLLTGSYSKSCHVEKYAFRVLSDFIKTKEYSFIEQLIVENSIILTPEISELIEDTPVKKMFESKALNDTLNSQLKKEVSNKNKYSKI